ncbi:conserved hypothetical protein [Leishmania mexicana MHOM/GT/2001/U1103]|uniref:Flagellar attachment zone protein 1 conserved domain-containing protein n=1 Tax=Leishmania mexicana (strain MHOM/GT/2001/U1103) TaxID=929439 RepID=E9AXI5_LEIMU|nr:conserved hypothetical protein [Leishmania mexicana MHOM/GT/2001/U1103]CBZ27676.1 conserved hypothetical protein [Leishmania mexicana MHOM/GT/2001/U1103]
MALSATSSIDFREDVPNSKRREDTKITESVATISIHEEPNESRRNDTVTESVATISIHEELNETRRNDTVTESVATISMHEEPSETRRIDKVTESVATISIHEEPSETRQIDKVTESVATISIHEEPSETRQIDKVTESVATISMHEEPSETRRIDKVTESVATISIHEEPSETRQIDKVTESVATISMHEEPSETRRIDKVTESVATISMHEEPSETRQIDKVTESVATISMHEEPSETRRIDKVTESVATISIHEEPSETRQIDKVTESVATISMHEEPSETRQIDKVTESVATISMHEEPSETRRIDKVTESVATISIHEEPSETRQIDKVTESVATISMHEEPDEGPEELHYEMSASTGLNATTQKDDIEFQVVDDIASKSERSVPYQVEDSRKNLDGLASTQQEEGAASPQLPSQGGVAAAPTSDIYALNPPPSRLSQRAAKAAQTPRSLSSAPITPRTRSGTSTYRPPAQQQEAKENEDAEVQPLVYGGESAPAPETATAPTPVSLVVTEHKRHFPGNKWESVVAASLDVVKRTVCNETADAIGVESQYVQVLNVGATATGMTCDISVGHAPTMTASEVDEKLSSYPYETTITLPDILTASSEHPQYGLGGALAPWEGTQAAAGAHEQQVEEEEEERYAPVGVPKAAPTKPKRKTKKAHRKLKNGSAASHARKATARVSGPPIPKKLGLRTLPKVLVTPRIYHYRAPRPGAERSTDKGSILYLDPRESTEGLGSRYSVSAATPHRGTNAVNGVNGSRSPSAPTYPSASVRNSAHIPPQRVERGVVSLALRKRQIIQAVPAVPPPQQQQQRAMAAPSDDASAHRYMNGVDHTANTHSVSRRSRSRSPKQLALAPGTDSASDAAPEEAAVTATPMAASGSAADQEDYIPMAEGVEKAADAEELLQKKQKAVAEYDTVDDEDDPVPAPAPNPFV